MKTRFIKFIEGLYAARKHKLLAFIRSYLPDKEKAKDILHSSFLNVIEKCVGKTPNEVTKILYRTARNLALDEKKRHKPDVSIDQKVPVPKGGKEQMPFLKNFIKSRLLNPEEEYYHKRIRARLDRAIAHLPERQQLVFTLHELEGKSLEEIANVLQTTVVAVKSIKKRALANLRLELADVYFEFVNLN